MPVRLEVGPVELRRFDAGTLRETLGAILSEFTDAAGVEAVRLEDTGANSVGVDATVAAAGAGYTYTTARTVMDFEDVNGDGLPDKVTKAPEEPRFRVQLDLGSRFAPEASWPAGAWGVSIDLPEYAFMGRQGRQENRGLGGMPGRRPSPSRLGVLGGLAVVLPLRGSFPQ
ncbi:hypothetical protein WMF27_39125 [Sorangium sp. So ce281]|uniref:hypothetical protein n=1 Tax=unclassified Sorangium TaxID=2621164 RepID=UPI003F63B141